MAIKQTNIERGRWRDKCREALASHIGKRFIPLIQHDIQNSRWILYAESYRRALHRVGQVYKGTSITVVDGQMLRVIVLLVEAGCYCDQLGFDDADPADGVNIRG